LKLRGADVLARTLVAAGTRRVFTLSGNHVMPVFDAALDAGLDLVHVRHEAPTRYGAVAAALGGYGEDVLTRDALKAALARAAGAGKPACVNVMIERLAAPRY
jgi:thiamine pyrophosphate-dependent acetolactate synthase large subunit-like protein